MYDGAVGHDCVVSFHQVQLAAVVLGCFVQTVDRAALGAGADGHAGDGLITADTIHRSCPTSARLHFLETGRKEQKQRQQGRGTEPAREKEKEEAQRTQKDMHTNRCMLVSFSAQ